MRVEQASSREISCVIDQQINALERLDGPGKELADIIGSAQIAVESQDLRAEAA